MGKLQTVCTAAALILITIITSTTSASPWMHPLKSRDDWEPFKTYRNLIGVRIIEAEEEEEDDWTVGICITKFGKKPVKKKEHKNWINGQDIPFTFVFTKETGTIEFTIGPIPTLTYILPQYAGRGMDEIHIAVNSYYEYDNFWTYSFITELQVNGESYNFVDIEGNGIYTYATISGLGCEDFVLTGKLWVNWIGKLPKKRRQAVIRLGEPCDSNVPPQVEPGIDLTGDCVIDFEDFAVVASQWLKNCPDPNSCYGSDFDQDQFVDYNDLALFADKWLDRKYAGGCGTEESPYLIYTANQLNSIGATMDDWDAHFKLMADIDLSEHTGNSFNTIGTPNAPFTGVFDGDNWQISFFTQGDGDENYVGLFRCIDDANAVVKNLRLYKPNVVTKGPHYAGALAAKLKNGSIINCSVDQGEVTGYEGYALTTGANFVGGLIGYNEQGSVLRCSTNCVITGYDDVGGLIGYNKNGTIEKSFTVGTTISAHDRAGGLVGKNEMGTITQSYAQKPVFAHDWVGGFIGKDIDGVIEECYSTGHVSENSDFRGGFIGDIDGCSTVNASFWDLDTGGFLNNNGIGIATRTFGMQVEETFISEGWDFTSPIWIIYEAFDYPLLFWSLTPYPSPMAWESAPEPNGNGAYAITMTAKTATAYDYNGVEYYFNNMTDSNHDSGWQDSPVYVDVNLIPQTEYTYRVKVSDLTPARNESAYSAPTSAMTHPDTTAPVPMFMDWEAVPVATGPNTITMTAVTATDEVAVEYYFNNLIDPCHSSGWQASRTYEDTGLDDLTEYIYVVRARDTSANHNKTYWSFSKSATTHDGTPPQPDPVVWEITPTALGPDSITMTVSAATDASGVRYYFHNVTDPNHDSNSWQEDTTYVDTGLDELTTYTYQVKARDRSLYKNEGTYSAEASSTTSADITPPEPNVMTWAILPVAVSPYSIEMTATTANDPRDVEYYFNNVTDPNHDSGWQDSPFFKDVDLQPSTSYTYRVKAHDKSAAYNETAYSVEESAQTQYAVPPTEELWTYVSIGTFDGRIYNGNEPNAIDNDIDNAALRIGDYRGGLEYQTILTFDTSLLPPDCNITSVTLQLTRGHKPTGGQDPFSLFGNCIIDVANPYFGSNVQLEVGDWNDVGCAHAVAMFTGDPNENNPMVSTEFDANGQSCINTNGTTQLRVYFENSTNGDGIDDYLGFYSGENEMPEYRPMLIINYTTRTPIVELASIASEDGRIWDIGDNGIGGGHDVDDTNDFALRLGDYSGYEVPDSAGYRNILSFDTSSLPDNCTILSAHLLLTRGADTGTNPFEWAGDCVIDIAAPYFGDSNELENLDWQAPASANSVANFLQDAGEEQHMLSTKFNAAGLSNIDLNGKTQLRFYFTTSTNLDQATDCLGFYSGESAVLTKQPKLLIRYSN